VATLQRSGLTDDIILRLNGGEAWLVTAIVAKWLEEGATLEMSEGTARDLVALMRPVVAPAGSLEADVLEFMLASVRDELLTRKASRGDTADRPETEATDEHPTGGTT
jgi:hypothetical protein